MLVLSRKQNQRIVINDNIEIVVIEIRGNKVRLGVQAPKDVSVHRREVYEAIKQREKTHGEKGDCIEKGLDVDRFCTGTRLNRDAHDIDPGLFTNECEYSLDYCSERQH